ncbi:MAG TPA: M14-type cytosolic carboxypeptidase [Dongiaceae bacterium]|nr:M14-type cytosolic carboxypeptidase [Dongiaceae bacterium]
MRVSAEFYGGNIEFLGIAPGKDVGLAIRPDPIPGFRQWFYFSIASAPREVRRLVITNADEALVPMGWPGYQAFRSLDNSTWTRVPTTYADGRLVIEHVSAAGPVWYAYFPPYLEADRDRLLAFCRADARASVAVLAQVGPHDALDLVEIGSEAPDALHVWAVCRQHPGEVQASWWADGFLRRLLDPADAEALDVLRRARVHIVPNMNPDGSRAGFHRCNRHGVNLNAAWNSSTVETSPAVRAVLDRVAVTGIDFCLDVHADEELPYVFVANVDRIVPPPSGIAAICDSFQTELGSADPAFRPRSGYVRPHTLAAPLSFCSPHIMHAFQAPALTLELPYKMVEDPSGRISEYAVPGCIATGCASLTALSRVLEDVAALRTMAGPGLLNQRRSQ